MRIVKGTARSGRVWGVIVVAAALWGCNASGPDPGADGKSDEARSALGAGNLGNPGVVPPTAHPGGLSLPEWTAIWWQQMLAIPFDQNPVFDTTGEDCALGEHGHVWFL